MISPEEAAAQVERLSGLDFFPRAADQLAGLKELRLAMQSAATVKIAEMVVTDVMAYQSESPKPAALRSAIWEMNEKLAVPKPVAVPQPSAHHCGRCQGFGYVGGHIGGERHAPWRWCDCANARRAQYESPNLVDEANAVRDKLVKRFINPINSVAGLKPAADGYHGDF